MDELTIQRDHEERGGAPLARERSGWFAQQLGEERRSEEPGVYRFIGTGSGSPNAGASTHRPTITDTEPTKPADPYAPARTLDALKWAAPASALEVLKAKRAHESALDKERLVFPAEAVALKEKPASRRATTNGRAQQRRRPEAKVKLGLALVLLSLVLPAPAAAHVGGAFWPAAKVLVAVDGTRVRVGTRVVRVDADTALCSGEGRSRLRRGVRTWTHFRCTFTTFTASGPGRDVEFRVHALTARRMVITNSRWILG